MQGERTFLETLGGTREALKNNKEQSYPNTIYQSVFFSWTGVFFSWTEVAGRDERIRMRFGIRQDSIFLTCALWQLKWEE